MEDNQNGRMGVRGGGRRRFIQPESSAIPKFWDFFKPRLGSLYIEQFCLYPFQNLGWLGWLN